jgi:photosystem II stability/assembly factor-like uncharacterized protein
VYRTVDGGLTWKEIVVPPVAIRCVAFATAANGWIGSSVDSTKLWATADSGSTWRPVDLPAPKPRGICGLSVVGTSVVYGSGLIGGGATVVKSVDGGATWRSIDLSAMATGLVDCHFFDADSGFVVGHVGTGGLGNLRALVLFTADGGDTWEARHTGTATGTWGWKLSFPTRRVGYASVESLDPRMTATRCLKTEDGGETWREIILTSELIMQGIGFATETVGWVGGLGDTQQTHNAGLNWSPAGWGESVNRIRFLHPTLGYAVGRTIYKYSEPTAVTPEDFTDVKSRYR